MTVAITTSTTMTTTYTFTDLFTAGASAYDDRDNAGRVSVDTLLEIATAITSEADRERMRCAVSALWNHDHQRITFEFDRNWRTSQYRQPIVELFRTLRFTTPSDLQDTVTVYRGEPHVSNPNEAAEGLSWSLDPAVAAWFALAPHVRAKAAGQRLGGWPKVVVATVPRSAIVYYSNERREAEVIIATVPAVTVWGDRRALERGFRDWEARKNSTSE